MDELVRTAEIYYNSSTNEVMSARRFFQKLDVNGDERVSLEEFLEFTSKEGHSHMNNPRFFKALDRDNSGTLEFKEVMVLYYIIRSGRPFCRRCGVFIPSMYFTCWNCFGYGNTSYCVCPECFKIKDFNHDRTHQFLDNYTLLEGKRREARSKREAALRNQHQPTVQLPAKGREPTSNAIVPFNKPNPKPAKAMEGGRGYQRG